MRWTLKDIPDLSNKTAIVTGGNIGLGFASSLALARHGAHVVIACRSTEKGQRAIARIKKEAPYASLDCMTLDLVDLASIADFAQQFNARYPKLHILMNNAGVVNLEQLTHTKDGHEMQMATNHFGHFSLTAHLLRLLLATEQARVVTLSSGGAKFGEIRFDDLDWRKRPYSRSKSYGDSKLANLLFMAQLQRRLQVSGSSVISVAAHPGLSGTERQQSTGMGGWLSRTMAQSVANGVRSQLLAATGPEVRGGDYYGPCFGIAGPPLNSRRFFDKLDTALAEKFWDVSCEVTGTGELWR